MEGVGEDMVVIVAVVVVGEVRGDRLGCCSGEWRVG